MTNIDKAKLAYYRTFQGVFGVGEKFMPWRKPELVTGAGSIREIPRLLAEAGVKKVLLVGSVACGKTTLAQRLNGLVRSYKKTQSIEVIGHTIDTPGEYLERRSLFSALVVTAADADEVLFLLDPTQDLYLYSPGQAGAFSAPVTGVVTKADLADEGQLRDGRDLLEMAGVGRIFTISAVTGEGMEELAAHLGALADS